MSTLRFCCTEWRGQDDMLDAIRPRCFPLFVVLMPPQKINRWRSVQKVRLVSAPKREHGNVVSGRDYGYRGMESEKQVTRMLDKRGEQPPHEDKTAAQLTRWVNNNLHAKCEGA